MLIKKISLAFLFCIIFKASGGGISNKYLPGVVKTNFLHPFRIKKC